MLVAAVVCPGPPALVAALTSGAAADLDDLRTACDRAVAVLARQRLDRLVVLGAGGAWAVHDPGSPPDLFRWGGPSTSLTAPAMSSSADPLPLPLAVGRFLLTRTPVHAGDLAFETVPASATASDCLGHGRALARSAPRVALLVIGDGATGHDERSPTAYDAQAQPYDVAVAAALGAGDAPALARLDPDLSRRLGAVGRAPWQVLAGAVGADDSPPLGPVPGAVDPGADRADRTADRDDAGAGLHAELLMSVSPYGVGYHVAAWWRA